MSIYKSIADYYATKEGMQAIINRHLQIAFEEIQREYGATPTYVSLEMQEQRAADRQNTSGTYCGCKVSLALE